MLEAFDRHVGLCLTVYQVGACLPLLFLHCHQSGIESLFLLSVLLAVLL
jgi:hypothetical protein